MKYLFCVKKLSNSNDYAMDGEELIIRSISSDTSKMLDEYSNEYQAQYKKAQISRVFVFLKLFLYLGGASLLIALLSNITSNFDIFTYLKEQWVLLLILGIIIGLYLVIKNYEKHKNIQLENDLNLKNIEEKLDQMTRICHEELGIHQEGLKIDFLAFRYTIQNNQFKVINSPYSSLLNIEMSVYMDRDLLNIYDVNDMYQIPKSSFRRISRIDKRVLIPLWNKNESFNSITYKPYKISMIQNSLIQIRWYYDIEFEIDGEEYHLFLPNYEIKGFSELIDLSYDE